MSPALPPTGIGDDPAQREVWTAQSRAVELDRGPTMYDQISIWIVIVWVIVHLLHGRCLLQVELG